MVYGPMDRCTLASVMYPHDEQGSRATLLVPCHNFPAAMAVDLMFKQITDMIQTVESSLGKDFCDAFMVMPKQDAESPWTSDIGIASWVLGYKKNEDYTLYLVKRDGLYDWWVPGGRWQSYLQAKDPNAQDAHGGVLDLDKISLSDFAAGLKGNFTPPIVTGVWSALKVGEVDWEKMSEGLGSDEENVINERRLLRAKGEDPLTLREYFFTLNPALMDQVGPDNLEGYIAARKWDTYRAFSKYINELRAKHGLENTHSFSFPHRWSDKLLERLIQMKSKTMSCWIVGGEVYDLDDDTHTEEHLHKGLDLLEALSEDTIVSVVDVHY